MWISRWLTFAGIQLGASGDQMGGSSGEDSDEVARMCLVLIEMRVKESIEDDFSSVKLDSWVLYSESQSTVKHFSISLEAVSA